MHRVKVNELQFPKANRDFKLHYSKLNTCSPDCEICNMQIPYIQFYEWQNSRSTINYNVLDSNISGKILAKEENINITKMQDTIENSELWRIPRGTFMGFDEENKIILR